MKKILSLLMMTLCLLIAHAQTDVTTFLGIPVDGSKSDMREKLIAKGFTPVQGLDYLQGEFNGEDVILVICTNKNKVYRIMLADVIMRGESDIKNRFNALVHQFENNKNYVSVDKYAISDDEDISYEMTTHKKKYNAVFYQNVDTTKVDEKELTQKMQERVLSKYTREQLQNPTLEIQNDVREMTAEILFDLLKKKSVWVRLIKKENSNVYFITMYYDNEYNSAHGDDL